MSPLRRLAMAVTATSMLAVGLAPAAQAVPAGPAEDTADALAAAVPTCMETYLNDTGWTDYLSVINRCGRTVRVKVVIAHGPDLACHTYRPGSVKSWSWGWPKRFDGLANC